MFYDEMNSRSRLNFSVNFLEDESDEREECEESENYNWLDDIANDDDDEMTMLLRMEIEK